MYPVSVMVTGTRRPTPNESTTSSGTWRDVIDHVIPVLRARGAYPAGYEAGTLRHKLHGQGDRLPGDHTGARYRIGGGVPAGAGGA